MIDRAEGPATMLHTSLHAERDHAAQMPTAEAALLSMLHAYSRLRTLGWRPAMYAPKDGTPFQAIEAGSCGIFRTWYSDNGRYCWAEDGGEIYPAHPILFRSMPKGEEG